MNPPEPRVTEDMLHRVSDWAHRARRGERPVDLDEVPMSDDERSCWAEVLGVPVEHVVGLVIREVETVQLSFYDARDGEPIVPVTVTRPVVR